MEEQILRPGDHDQRIELDVLDRPHRLLGPIQTAPAPSRPQALSAQDEAARDLDRELHRHGPPYGRRLARQTVASSPRVARGVTGASPHDPVRHVVAGSSARWWRL
jgi:hypothetical protein